MPSSATSARSRRHSECSSGRPRCCTSASSATPGSASTSSRATTSSSPPGSGPQETEHVRIRIGEGICGAAAASGKTEIVDDVEADSRYIACFPSTRSEIVVPIFAPERSGTGRDRVLGEIDIDSDEPAAFDEDDRAFLEHVARMVSARL